MAGDVVGIMHQQACETCAEASFGKCLFHDRIELVPSDDNPDDVCCKSHRPDDEERPKSGVQQRIEKSANLMKAQLARHYALVEQMFPAGCEVDTAQDNEPTWAKVIRVAGGSVLVDDGNYGEYIGAEQIRDVRPGRGQAELFG